MEFGSNDIVLMFLSWAVGWLPALFHCLVLKDRPSVDRLCQSNLGYAADCGVGMNLQKIIYHFVSIAMRDRMIDLKFIVSGFTLTVSSTFLLCIISKVAIPSIIHVLGNISIPENSATA
jgi:hypothetical protein